MNMATIPNSRVNRAGLESVPVDWQPVTPDDANNLPGGPCLGLSWAEDGAIHMVTAAGEEKTLPAGSLAPLFQHSIRVRKVFADGTTANGIVAWY